MASEDEREKESQLQAAQAMAPEISGGQLGYTNMGGQIGQYIEKQVNQTYNPVVGTGTPQTPGQFQVACLITVLEDNPISSSSRIFRGFYHSDVTGDRPAAIKIIAAKKKNYREAKIYFSVPYHKNIVERFAADTFNFRGQPSIFIAMERCDCNLYDHVKSEVKNGTPFDAEKYLKIAYQILVALDYLHSHNVVHGDFKPANVLLILDGLIVKVADFGLSRAVTPGNTSTQLTSPQGGTTGWQAPEILAGSPSISFRSDVFPCGLTLFFAWSHGKHPYGDRTVSLNHYILEGINRDLSGMLVPFAAEAELLIEKTLRRNPHDRPYIKELLWSTIFWKPVSRPQKTKKTPTQMAEKPSLDEIFDRALKPVDEKQLNKKLGDTTIFRVTASELENAMRAFIRRNPLQSKSTLVSKGTQTDSPLSKTEHMLAEPISSLSLLEEQASVTPRFSFGTSSNISTEERDLAETRSSRQKTPPPSARKKFRDRDFRR